MERAIQPAAAVLIRSFVAPGLLVRSPRSRVAIAAGGFILVSRAAYERVGGHKAMRHELVDDQMLAVRLKAAGTPLALAGSAGRVRVRMYVGARETVRGWRKNTSAGLGGSVVVAAILACAGVASSLAPAVAIVRGPRRAGALGLVLQLAARCRGRAVPDAPTGVGALPGGRAGAVDPLAAQLGRQASGRDRLARPPLRGLARGQSEYALAANVV